ncbi:hypothetical protein REPUB_Repub17cG0099600 [Reevesia pubescens]
MEKNQTSCPKAVCEKIFRTFTFGPAFSTIRRISSRQKTSSSPAKHARNPSLPNSDPPRRPLDIKTKMTSSQGPKPTSKEGSEVPIKFDYTTQLPTSPTVKPKPITSTDMVQSGKPIVGVAGNGQHAQNYKSKPKAEKSNGQMQVQIEGTQHYDDTFSAFIYQTRKRIMSPDEDYGENSSKVAGQGHGGIGKDHHFSDYINQTN